MRRRGFSLERYYARTIGDMSPGKSAWVVPWSLRADENGQYWLHPNYATRHGHRGGGTREMKVTRLDDGSFEVNIKFVRNNVVQQLRNTIWKPKALWPGVENGEWLPVSRVISS